MLPDLDIPQEEGLPNTGRDLQRIRMISLQKMIEATALAKIKRALDSKTSVSGQQADYQPGELVDHYTAPNQQDISGWRGPATVLKNIPREGKVQLEWMHTTIFREYRFVRRFMDFTALAYFGMYGSAYPVMNALAYIGTYVAQMPKGNMTEIGYVRANNQWRLTAHTTSQLAGALHYIVEAVLQLRHVRTVRAAHGVKYFGKVHNVKSSVLMWWQDTIEQYSILETDTAGDFGTRNVVGEGWRDAKYLQFLSTTEGTDLTDAVEELNEQDTTSDITGPDASGRTDISDPDRLSTIQEESEYVSTRTDRTEVVDNLNNPVKSLVCPDWCETDAWQQLEESQRVFMQEIHLESDKYPELIPVPPLQTAPRKDLPPVSIDTHAVYQAFGADTEEYGKPDIDVNGNTYHEIMFPDDTAKLIADAPAPPGYSTRLRIYPAVKRAVVERDDDILTPNELQQHKKLVLAGIREELISWIKHKCFERKPRRLARNILDVRWVAKWKFVKASSVDKGYAIDATTTKREDGKVRVIRMRMTLRGSKDWDALMLETYSGTAKRLSQKLVASEAATRGWAMAAIDIRKAFLKGVSYDELAKETGEPRRDVNFELTEEAAAVLRTIPGYENFDHRYEVLSCVRPGTGCKDAPRCWSIQLAKVTKGIWGAKPTTHDDHLLVRHKGPENSLDFIGTEHVDDIKVACMLATLKMFISVLEETFGKGELEIQVDSFDCCGMKHTITDKGYELDQIEYVSKLKTIANEKLTAGKDDDEADEYNAKMFLSLVMAIAFAMMTRWDIHIYITALQRWLQKPCYRHIRALNVIVRWTQRHPKKILYRWMLCTRQLECHSDTGFRRENDKEGLVDGRSAHGANFIRMGVDESGTCLLYTSPSPRD